MTILRTTCRLHIAVAVTCLTVLTTGAMTAPVGAESSVLTTARPSTLLTIDQNRTTVIDRIVAEVRHVGPMAQDFHAAFGLGDSDKSIGMQDIEGVALAAIQGCISNWRRRVGRSPS